ncbi:MAG: cytochrome c [Caldilineaceae bacterium]
MSVPPATAHPARVRASPALNGSEFLTADDPSQAIQLVLQGRGEMPSFSDVLSNRQIAAVLSTSAHPGATRLRR